MTTTTAAGIPISTTNKRRRKFVLPIILACIFVLGVAFSFLVVRAEIEIHESYDRASISATATEAGGCFYEAYVRGYGPLSFPIDNDPNPCTKNRMIAWYLQIKEALAKRLNELGFDGDSIVQEIQISLLLHP